MLISTVTAAWSLKHGPLPSLYQLHCPHTAVVVSTVLLLLLGAPAGDALGNVQQQLAADFW
jgi:hypothetical protein